MLKMLERTMRVSATSGVMITIAIWGTGSAWAQCPANESAKFTAADGAFRDMFGRSVSINGDTALVGAWGNTDGGTESGSAYIFQRDVDGAESWGQVSPPARRTLSGG